jgi:H+/Cl- antiporter ClcA
MISQQLFVYIFLAVILLLCEGLSQPKSVSQLIASSHIRSDAIVQSLERTTANTHSFNLVCDERFNNFRDLDKSTQKTQQFRNEVFLMVLSVVTGTTTAAIIVKSKLILSILTSKWPNHWLTSLAGGITVSFLLLFDKNLSVNPFTLPMAINPKQSNRKEELHTTILKNEWSALSGSGFSLVRQLLRLIATMLAVSSGNSMGEYSAYFHLIGLSNYLIYNRLYCCCCGGWNDRGPSVQSTITRAA